MQERQITISIEDIEAAGPFIDPDRCPLAMKLRATYPEFDDLHCTDVYVGNNSDIIARIEPRFDHVAYKSVIDTGVPFTVTIVPTKERGSIYTTEGWPNADA